MTRSDEIFSEIQRRLDADPGKAASLNAAFGFDLKGDGGGAYHIVLQDGRVDVGRGSPETPDITIAMATPDFFDLVSGKLDSAMAFMSGRLRITGDASLAMKLPVVLR